MGDHAIASGVDVGQTGAHTLVHCDRPACTCLCAGSHQQLRVGSYSHRNQDEVSEVSARPATHVGQFDHQPPGARGRGARFAPYCRTCGDLNIVGAKLGTYQCSQLGIDSGEDLGQCFDLGHSEASQSQALGHLQADVTRPDD